MATLGPSAGDERDALPRMPIDSRQGAARAHRARLSSVPLPGLREAVQRSQRRSAEPDAIPERRYRPRGALATALQTELAGSGRDVPDPRLRVQPRGGPRLGSQAHADPGGGSPTET